jgi:hypothetical protein
LVGFWWSHLLVRDFDFFLFCFHICVCFAYQNAKKGVKIAIGIAILAAAWSRHPIRLAYCPGAPNGACSSPCLDDLLEAPLKMLLAHESMSAVTI